MNSQRRAWRLALTGILAALPALACEDPARPIPPAEGATLSVDSDPRGGRILLDGVDTGEETAAVLDQVALGARRVEIELDTSGLEYTYADLVVVDPSIQAEVFGPLTIRCSSQACLREAVQFHAHGNLRFAVNAAGPIFLYDGLDAGIVWPSSTQNTYASIGAATITALVNSDPVALGTRNVGAGANYWAGRPLPSLTSAATYQVSVPAWLTPTVPANGLIRGIEVVHDVIVDAAMPDVMLIRVTWRNITTDSLYRTLDPTTPSLGVTYTDAYLGFILDADVGAFTESDDDLVSYSAARNLVFTYDGDLAVSGFSGGWSARPALVGLMQLEGPGADVRLNAWPRTSDFVSGLTDAVGRALLTAQQTGLPNHPDPRIGYAPDVTRADYQMSITSGPLTLGPGEQATALFAVLLAAPTPETFVSGEVQDAGDPEDATRALADVAAGLFALADALAAQPSQALPTPALTAAGSP